jgi:hypothetical protein
LARPAEFDVFDDDKLERVLVERFAQLGFSEVSSESETQH